jgi:hypothetical protein
VDNATSREAKEEKKRFRLSTCQVGPSDFMVWAALRLVIVHSA